MKPSAETVLIDGPSGPIELIVDNPGAPRGVAAPFVCHPHPLFGGTNTNKVTQTLARTFAALGYVALRPTFAASDKAPERTTMGAASAPTCSP